jgi:hypothetical protein
LDKWLKHTIRSKDDIVIKKLKWLNAKEHFLGNHTLCTHTESDFHWKNANNTEALKVLDKLLQKGLAIIETVEPSSGSTQPNEAFHNVNAKYAKKESII